MLFRALIVSCLGVVLVAACGGEAEQRADPVESIPTMELPPQPKTVRVYFLREGKVTPVPREISVGAAVGRGAMLELFKGPTGGGLSTAIPPDTTIKRLSIADGIADVELSNPLEDAATAQVVYTLTQFDSVRAVSFESAEPIGRGELEDLTPSVLVESPLPGQEVHTPLGITGTANTFEATFNVELVDEGGEVVAKRFVTATSGSGMRGTFAVELPFEITNEGLGKLLVFELSAEDGSRIHEQEIPLQLTLFP
jgi:immunoglobulin-like protein involved in spore germination/sporulation and spore germination protein